MTFSGTLKEIDRILRTPPVSPEVAQKYILQEWDKYARLLGYADFEDFKSRQEKP